MSDKEKAVFYLRRSVEDTTNKSFSLDAQQNRCQDYADKHGLTVIRVYQDEISGGLSERPEFDEMLVAAKGGEFDCIITVHTSRFFRESTSALIHAGWLSDRCGVRLIFTDQPELDTTGGLPETLLHSFFAIFDEQYRRDISAHRKRIHEQRAGKGYHIGRAPFGYQKSESDPYLIPEPDEAKIVEYIFSVFKTNMFSYENIARALNENGYYRRKGKSFKGGTIKHILSNRIYIGHFCFRREWKANGRHEPIIDEDVFYQCQEIFAARARKKPRKKKKETCVFRRLMHCSECGYLIWASAESGKRPMYQHKVDPKTHDRECVFPKFSISALELEAKWDMIFGAMVLPEDWIMAIRKKAELEKFIDVDVEAVKIERQMAVISRKFASLEIEETEFTERLSDLRQKRDQLQSSPKLPIDVDSLLLNLGSLLKYATVEEKHNVLKLLVKDIKINPETWEFVGIRPYPLFRELFQPICLDYGIELIQTPLRAGG